MGKTLETCPFCSSADVHQTREAKHFAFCHSCGAFGPLAESAEGAALAWNLSWTLAPLSDAILDCQSDERERICCELLNLGTTKRARVTLAAAVGAIRSRARKIEERLPAKKPTKTEVPK
jgi:hypothetical protein